ncbi:hypothetical protein A3A38_04795 [Candidatus Kaiserbacteria bacterium RIFCSPLOWO2_01_FULL_53_17]|uniref:Ribonuclease n=1 Tax=Candidatus Kaiserbacteria bacterium RIFCSPLOWO2_01_FULL_53_17 TaxID=1798511 RepID=A0A1F6EHR3_9BACT|nr:MAG: hypothetical protein A3A38_04795 [Candidatus Kaiserbacteria bacterium RIFCSPLOWO2_01_FULL_53_17]
MQWYIGVDEAGRGALAGPVCVGAVLYPSDFDWREVFTLITKRRDIPKLRDSKHLSAQQRDILFAYIAAHRRLRHATAFIEASRIDRIGIAPAAREAARQAVKDLHIRAERVHVLLDAGLSVPQEWSQESFVHGDENIPAIAIASIVAKVTRDRLMEELSMAHSVYGFEQHKGYGTTEHFRAIRKHGAHPLLHRKSFLTALA